MIKEEIIRYIKENNLRPFEQVSLKLSKPGYLATKDAKAIFDKVIARITKEFVFPNTKYILNLFIDNNLEKINQRRAFFREYVKKDNSFLKDITLRDFKIKINSIMVTEVEDIYFKARKLGLNVMIITSMRDIEDLKDYDLVKVIECERSALALEQLPNAILIDNLDEAMLEQNYELFIKWKEGIAILNKELDNFNIDFTKIKEYKFNTGLEIGYEALVLILEEVNKKIQDRIKKLSITGENLVASLQGALPDEIKTIIDEELNKTKLPKDLFDIKIPVEINQRYLESYEKEKRFEKFFNFYNHLLSNKAFFIMLPKVIKEAQELMLYYDFIYGLSKLNNFDEVNIGKHILFENARNLLLHNPELISFQLGGEYKASILTGANSGGKTTLIEHILQGFILGYMGINSIGIKSLPIVNKIYYFAKNKGSQNKGAFETLLNNLARINPKTANLILADEIEALTEPGVAAKIIKSTIEYFSERSFIIIATHLGQELEKEMPRLSRIDGIEAKGLDEHLNLIVSHNPVLGRLARSTPELIIEKLAKAEGKEYYKFLFENL